MNSKVKVSIAVATVMLLSTVWVPAFLSCGRPEGPKKRSVAAVFPVTVDAFLQFQEEAKKVLSEHNVEVYYLSAEGDPSRFQTVVDAALLKKPDVLVLVGTQLTNTGLGPQYEQHLPKVISSCISDPSKVEYLSDIGLDPPRKKPVAIITDMPQQDAYSSGAQLIRRVTPEIKKAGILYNNAEINSKDTAGKMAEALRAQRVEVIEGVISGEEDVEKVARYLVLQGAQLLIIPHDKFVIKKAATVVKIGMEAPTGPIPVFSLDDGTVRKDGAAYGVSISYGFLGKLTAEVCLKILNGEAPEQMPIIQQEAANTYFNFDTWVRLGLPTIPEEIKQKSVVYHSDQSSR